jgi:hypothetical protein
MGIEAVLARKVEGIDHCAEYVELQLIMRSIPDPHRLGSVEAGADRECCA